jgi:hypothetical protein
MSPGSIAACTSRGSTLRQVAGDAATGDVRHGARPIRAPQYFSAAASRIGAASVAPRRFCCPRSGHVRIRSKLGHLEHQFARQRISIGVQSAGGQGPASRSPGPHAALDRIFFTLDGTDDKSRQIVIARQRTDRASPPFRHRSERSQPSLAARLIPSITCSTTRGVELAHRNIIEEKKRLGALRQNIVHAVVHEYRRPRWNECRWRRRSSAWCPRHPRWQRARDRASASDRVWKSDAKTADRRQSTPRRKVFRGHGGDTPLGVDRRLEIFTPASA